MQVNEASIIITLICSSVMMLAIHLLRRWIVSCGRGLRVYLILVLACLFRLLVPVELPPLQYIPVTSIYTPIFLIMYEELSFGGFTITVCRCLLWIWGVVAAIQLLRYVYKYLKSVNGLWKTSREDEYLSRILQELQNGKRAGRIKIMRNPYVGTPVSAGIINRCIVIPEGADERDIPFMIRHELSHILNGDLITKALLNILCCVFWFHPFMYLLRKDIGQIAEMRCDQTVTSDMNDEDKADYLEMILSVFHDSGRKKIDRSCLYLFGDMDAANIKERFEAVGREQTKATYQSVKNVLVVVVVVSLVAVSYLFSSKQYRAAAREVEKALEQPGIVPLSWQSRLELVQKRMPDYDVDGYWIDPETGLAGLLLTDENREQARRIIPIPESSREEMFTLMKQEFIRENGVLNGDTTRRSDVYDHLYPNIKKEDRLAGGWTLSQYERQYREAFIEAVQQAEPDWEIGQPFDERILDSVTRDMVDDNFQW